MQGIYLVLMTLFFVSFTACVDNRAGVDKKTDVGGVSQVIDSDNDGLSDEFELANDLNITNPDTDGDGLDDFYEVNHDELNATNPDTDGDTLLDGAEVNQHGTRPDKVDTDDDGLDDPYEVSYAELNATNPDTDGDTLLDGAEVNQYGTLPDQTDTDADGLDDPYEVSREELNATNPDTDGDTLLDGAEVNQYGTRPDKVDTDQDGLEDPYEVSHGELNATNPDTDGDTLLDGAEVHQYGTRPDKIDTDEDGLGDLYEVGHEELNATNPDTDGDTLSDGAEVNEHGTLPHQQDTDGDGLDDLYEVSRTELNATNADTDGDTLLDGEEVNNYGTLPNNPDSDSDGLSDSEELLTHMTNPLEADSDGDCLLDGFEINYYGTNVNSNDTDGDSVEDGIEIYTYGSDELNLTCLSQPETQEGGHNPSPAIDGIPDISSDVINALDPTNDSDGDGQGNSKENNCVEGDAKDKEKMCPYIIDSEEGQVLTEHGYSYVPGGFDVDGDGVNEGGFWISRYQARKTETIIPSETVIGKVGNVNQYVSKHFEVLNRNIDVTSYNESWLSEATALAGNQLIFDEESVAGLKRVSSFTPYLALVCLSEYRLQDKNGTDLNVSITLPTLKQYMQVKMLLDADLANNGDGRHIRNGLLGTDPNVPLFKYNLIIDEFGEERQEYVRNIVQLRDIHGTPSFSIDDVPDWWDVDPDKFKSFGDGANSTQDLGHGIGPDKDSYAVIVRGGQALDVTEGVSGALTDDDGKTNGISFRAATPYLY